MLKEILCVLLQTYQAQSFEVSHIKPDSECEGGEGADPANILMLSILPDKLFDCEAVEGFQRVAFISFNDEGRVMRAPRLQTKSYWLLACLKLVDCFHRTSAARWRR